MRIIIASDSFKEWRTSVEVNGIIASVLAAELPGADVVTLAVSDGGEGVMDALLPAVGGQRLRRRITGPMGGAVEAEYAVLGDGTAVIEIAECAGLRLIAPGARDILRASTLGLGELIKACVESGTRKFIIGLGGSGTNDLGTGALHALGFRFLDASGGEIALHGARLRDISNIRPPDSICGVTDFSELEFTFLCDVASPLTGPNGAARTFAPQKGASAVDVEMLEEGAENFAAMAAEKFNVDLHARSGLGAAGGTAAAFYVVFPKVFLVNGAEYILGKLDFADQIHGADLVITGEGQLDRTTLMGKCPCAIARYAREAGIPVIGIFGKTKIMDDADRQAINETFTAVMDSSSAASADVPPNSELDVVYTRNFESAVGRLASQLLKE